MKLCLSYFESYVSNKHILRDFKSDFVSELRKFYSTPYVRERAAKTPFHTIRPIVHAWFTQVLQLDSVYSSVEGGIKELSSNICIEEARRLPGTLGNLVQ